MEVEVQNVQTQNEGAEFGVCCLVVGKVGVAGRWLIYGDCHGVSMECYCSGVVEACRVDRFAWGCTGFVQGYGTMWRVVHSLVVLVCTHKWWGCKRLVHGIQS